MSDDTTSGGMAILAKAGSVLTTLETQGDLTAAGIAEHVGEPVSSTYRLLAQLVRVGWVDKGHERGTFRVSASFLRLGSYLEDQINIRQASENALRELQKATRLTSFLCVLRSTGAVCIDRYDGRGVRSLSMRIGDSLPLDRGGAPIALLANSPEQEREELVANLATTEIARTTLTTRLDEARTRGLAWSDEDVTPGIAAIGAPVFNHRGELEGAISVSGLREQLIEHRADIERLVADAASAASEELGYRPTREEGARS